VRKTVFREGVLTGRQGSIPSYFGRLTGENKKIILGLMEQAKFGLV